MRRSFRALEPFLAYLYEHFELLCLILMLSVLLGVVLKYPPRCEVTTYREFILKAPPIST